MKCPCPAPEEREGFLLQPEHASENVSSSSSTLAPTDQANKSGSFLTASSRKKLFTGDSAMDPAAFKDGRRDLLLGGFEAAMHPAKTGKYGQ